MRILQVVPSLNEPCGIGYFARAMHRGLVVRGHEVSSESMLAVRDPCDLVILHHHSELLSNGQVQAFVKSVGPPVLLFSHADDARAIYPLADGVIAMAPGLLTGTDRPTFYFPHPAWTPA